MTGALGLRRVRPIGIAGRVAALFVAVLLGTLWGGADRVAAQMLPGMALSGGAASEATPAVPEGAEAPAEIAPDDVETLARLMETPGFAAWLRAQAAEVETQPGPGGRLGGGETSNGMVVETVLARFEATLRDRIDAWVTLPEDLDRFFEGMMAVVSPDDRVRNLIAVVIFLLIGSGLEWLYWQSAGPTLRRLEGSTPDGPWQAFRQTVTRLGLRLAGMALFAVGTLGTFVALTWDPISATAVILALGSLIAVRLIALAAVFVLAPFAPALRLVPLDDRAARWLFGWIVATATVVVIGLAIRSFWAQVGGASAPTGPLADLIATSLALMLLLRLWLLPRMTDSSRPAGLSQAPDPQVPAGSSDPADSDIATAVSAADPDADGGAETAAASVSDAPSVDADDRAAAAAPMPKGGRRRKRWMATGLILLLYVLWLIGADRLLLTVAILALIGPAVVTVRFLAVDPWQRWRTERYARELARAGLDEGAGDLPLLPVDYVSPIIARVARFAVVVGALVLLGTVWQGVGDGMIRGPLERLLEASADILVALLIAELVWTLAKTAIDRRLSAFQAAMGPGGGGGEGGGGAVGSEARLATLLPLVRNTVMTLLLAMVALIGLSSLGINIGPLLAGAGVVGIAVGFGAQTLVRDIVSGIFFLIDDAFRVGEYIEMDALRGTVEGISLRSMKLRHHRGAIHTVPFGEIKSVTNYSRDWVIVKLEFRVPFETDLALVKKLVKQIGKEMLEDPTYGPQFLEPVKSQGVRRMEEFNMVIGVKFMTKPGEQWLIRREVYQRIRDTFDARGIHFAQRNVKVEVIGPGDGPLDEETRKAAVGAAQDAIERQAGVAS